MLPKIIGTSHIAKESIEEIKREVEQFQPEIIAVELDLERAQALLSHTKNKHSWKNIFQMGVRGFVFAKIGQYVQQKLGQSVGVDPGSEMKTAIELAKKKKLEIALIDQPLRVTLKNFSHSLTWREKFRFVADFFKGIFFQKKVMKELGLNQLDLKKVPSSQLIEKMIGHLKVRYPNVYKTLVEDRNKYMIKHLVRIMRTAPEKKILVVVGAGHKKGMEELLLKVDVV